MPESLRHLAEQAIKKHRKRLCAPEVVSKPEHGDHGQLTCPYREEDEDLWLALLMECFGTRSHAVAHSFMRQLSALCPDVLYEGEQHRRRDEEVLRQALAIVYSFKPRNEADAAQAAQYVALHLTTMKLGAHLGNHNYVDPRTAASLAALAKASAGALNAIRGARQPRNIKQTIIVKKETRYYDQRSVTLGEGVGKSGGQPEQRDGLRAHARDEVIDAEYRPTVPSPDEGGRVVPIASSKGKAGVPDARWNKPRGSKG